jgi:Spy/CpxP family protein refolding chaperone
LAGIRKEAELKYSFAGFAAHICKSIIETTISRKELYLMKSTKVMIPVALVITLLLAVTVYAGPGRWGGGMGMGPGPSGAVWGDLTKDQQKQVESLRLDLLKKMQPLQAQMAQKRIEMMEMASKDNPDEKAIEKKRQEIWSLQDTMRNERRAMSSKFRSLLTPEQRQKLGAFGPGAGIGCGACFGGRQGMGRGRAFSGCPMQSFNQ